MWFLLFPGEERKKGEAFRMNLLRWKRQVGEKPLVRALQNPASGDFTLVAPLSAAPKPGEQRTRPDDFPGRKPRRTPFASRWRDGFQVAVMVAAVLLTLLRAAQEPHLPLALGAAVVVTAFLLIVRLFPLVWTRERPLTLSAPLVFAFALWLGPLAAALGALTVGLIQARFGWTGGETRRGARFQGAVLALAALAAHRTLALAGGTSRLLEMPRAEIAVTQLAGAGWAALVFALTAILLAAPLMTNPEGEAFGSVRARQRWLGAALLHGLGLLSVVVLAPFQARYGLLAALPLILLLIFAHTTTRLTRQIASLRVQLETAEAMGLAVAADPTLDTESEGLLERFLTLAQSLVEADRAIVWLFDAQTGRLTPQGALPDTGAFADYEAVFGKGLLGHAAVRLRPRLIADAARDPRRLAGEPGEGAWLLYPIVVHQELLGVAHWMRPATRPFAADELARLHALVPQCGLALENVRARRSLRLLAATDGLTQLWNHQRTHQLLREEMRRSSRYHRALSVLMLDVDSFKSFNDTYGHPNGDQLLRLLAQILRENVRAIDHVGRCGGEEFLIILPETAKDDACRLAERIRAQIEQRLEIAVEGKLIRRTVSVGVASSPEDALNPAEIVQRADEALYRAKHSGKNRVLWA